MHSWNLTAQEAIRLQNELKQKIILQDQFSEISKICGIDVGFRDNYRITRAALVVLDFETLEPVEKIVCEIKTTFPYVPGLLSFRESPAILKGLGQLKSNPDLLVLDGHGIAHPRRFGIACHVGLVSEIPALGVAKKILVGSHGELPENAGEWTNLEHNGEIIGAVLRTRQNVKPVYVSPGHKICLESAVDFVRKSMTGYRLPETTRQAHRLASAK